MTREVQKYADAIGSGTADPSTAPARSVPVPQTSIENKPAPGLKGPTGLAGRTTYSRVNTGTPPTPDMGASAQKSQAPRGLEFLPKMASTGNQMNTSMAGRPALQDLVKQAMAGAAERVDISLRAAQKIASPNGPSGQPEKQKTAASRAKPEHISTELTEKLASAMNHLAVQLNPKLAEASGVGPGQGPGALEVLQAESDGQNIDAGQTGAATQQPPKDPPLQKDPTRVADSTTGLETNDAMQLGGAGGVIDNEKASLKTASLHATNLVALGLARIEVDANGQVKLASMGTGALGGGLLGGLAGGAIGHVTGMGAGKGAALGGGLGAAGGAAYGAKKAQEPLKMAAAGETPLETKGRQAGGAVGALAGGALGGATGSKLVGAVSKNPVSRALGGGAGALMGAGVGGHVGSRLGRAAGGAAEKGLDSIDPKGKEASVRKLAARMVKSANELQAAAGEAPPEVSAEQKRRALVGLGGSTGSLLGSLSQEHPVAGAMLGGAGGAALTGGLVGAHEGAGLGNTLGGAARGAGGSLVGGAMGALGGAAGGGLTGGAIGALGGAGIGALAGAATGRPIVNSAAQGLGFGATLGGGLGAIHGGITGGMEGAGRGYDVAMQGLRDRAGQGKVASILARNLAALGLNKMAEDAIYPAQISASRTESAGAELPPGVSASGEDVPTQPSDMESQVSRMLSSNEAAINFTKGDAKGDPKQDLKDVLVEPALSSSTDKTLNATLDNTGEAGTKISSIKAAAARALLHKLAQQMLPTPDKKVKKSAMGGAPTTPQAASGFSANAQP